MHHSVAILPSCLVHRLARCRCQPAILVSILVLRDKMQIYMQRQWQTQCRKRSKCKFRCNFLNIPRLPHSNSRTWYHCRMRCSNAWGCCRLSDSDWPSSLQDLHNLMRKVQLCALRCWLQTHYLAIRHLVWLQANASCPASAICISSAASSWPFSVEAITALMVCASSVRTLRLAST